MSSFVVHLWSQGLEMSASQTYTWREHKPYSDRNKSVNESSPLFAICLAVECCWLTLRESSVPLKQAEQPALQMPPREYERELGSQRQVSLCSSDIFKQTLVRIYQSAKGQLYKSFSIMNDFSFLLFTALIYPEIFLFIFTSKCEHAPPQNTDQNFPAVIIFRSL